MKKTTLQRFTEKTRHDPGTGCLLWVGARDQDGYGDFWFGGRVQPAHRASYEMFVGEIPEGLQIDHLCRNPSCVNHEHLEPVTNKENALRGIKATATHCVNGHEFTPETTGRGVYGRRYCRVCKRLYMNRRYAANREQILAAERERYWSDPKYRAKKVGWSRKSRKEPA